MTLNKQILIPLVILIISEHKILNSSIINKSKTNDYLLETGKDILNQTINNYLS